VQLTVLLSVMLAEDARRLGATYQFAAAAHAGQLRNEGTPFIEHPVAVAVMLWNELGCRDVDMLAAALTHDVLEDSCVEPDALRTLLGDRAFEMVERVTKPTVPFDRKARRDIEYLESVRLASADVRLLKLADRIHNLRSVPVAGDPAKAKRYLTVSRAEFLPLAMATDPTAARMIEDACDVIEAYLAECQ